MEFSIHARIVNTTFVMMIQNIPTRTNTKTVTISIKGLKETTHGYKKNETKRLISRANCNTMFLFFLTADSQILRNVHS